MAITASDIKTRHEEFSSLQDSFIEEKITKAEQHCNEETLGDQYDDAVEWWTCHLITTTPIKIQTALLIDADIDTSIYKERWAEIARPKGRAWRV